MRRFCIPLCASVLALLAFLPSAIAQTSSLPAPWFGPAGGTYTYNLTVAINESIPNMAMFYTTDGSTPSAIHGTRYLGAIPVTANVMIKAVAVDLSSPPQYSSSPVSTASYVLNLPYEAPLPQGEWAWESGSSTQTPATPCGGYLVTAGSYGTLGVPSPTNVPGSRQVAMHWTDNNGNFWLFGGEAFAADGQCDLANDLWMFNPGTKQWAWMSGSSTYGSGEEVPGIYGTLGQFSPGNVPGSREQAVTWTDASGNLWLFGGYGVDSVGTEGDLNDVWEFHPTTRQWAWMAGSKIGNQHGAYGYLHVPQAGNTPGARFASVGWTDRNGNLWLFGGASYDATGKFGDINDLWEFNPSTGLWAWMGGSHILNHPGVYGTHDVPSPNNIPGARGSASGWMDAQGNFWLFGGGGYGAGTTSGSLNDLWEFNPSNLNWTWAAGNAYAGTYPGGGQAGVYDKLGVPDPGNNPGSRINAATWTDAQGNLWLFGGAGFDSVGNSVLLNDLWEFDRSKWLWAWMGGSKTGPGTGNYGTFRVPSSETWPGPRIYAGSWTDKSGNLWLFGGNAGGGTPPSYTYTWLNDLFEYQIP